MKNIDTQDPMGASTSARSIVEGAVIAQGSGASRAASLRDAMRRMIQSTFAKEQDESPDPAADLRRYVPLKSQFILTGNVRDLQIHEVGGVVTAATLETVLASELRTAGYADLLWFDPVAGFRVLDRLSGPSEGSARILNGLGLPVSGPVPVCA